jgi:SnoaL-like polyketide cyclase
VPQQIAATLGGPDHPTVARMLRNLLSYCGICLALGCVSAVPRGGSESPAPQRAVRAFRLLFEQGIARRDTGAISEAVTPVLVFHERGDTVRVPREKLLGLASSILTGFPDVRFRIESVVEAGDSAAVRLSFTGTNTGVWEGMGPTGRRVKVSEMFFCHLVGPRLSECWQDWDKWGLIQQLAGHSN